MLATGSRDSVALLLRRLDDGGAPVSKSGAACAGKGGPAVAEAGPAERSSTSSWPSWRTRLGDLVDAAATAGAVAELEAGAAASSWAWWTGSGGGALEPLGAE